MNRPSEWELQEEISRLNVDYIKLLDKVEELKQQLAKYEPVRLEVLGDEEIDNVPLVKMLLKMDDARCKSALSLNPQNPNYQPLNVPIYGLALAISQATIDQYKGQLFKAC
jgi:hypothetical protein